MTIRYSKLIEVGPPWVYAAELSSHEVQGALASIAEAGGEVVELDCASMPNLGALFDAFADAALFPDYFGRNWPAFDECLADLDWLPGTSYVFVLRNPNRLLEQEPVEIPTFWRIVGKVATEWAEPIDQGEPWDRAAVPFHFLLDVPFDTTPAVERIDLAGVEAVILKR